LIARRTTVAFTTLAALLSSPAGASRAAAPAPAGSLAAAHRAAATTARRPEPPAARRALRPDSALAVAASRAGLRLEVLSQAMLAYGRAADRGLATKPLLTVIDYSLPSRERRLWVLDLLGHRVLARELVAHGRGTGDDLAERFSNRPGSLQSSLGTFLTGATYIGKHGLSLRLRGLDSGLNDAAEARGIVMHGAEYVNHEIVAKLGRLGRSQGCPALAPPAAARIIRLIRDGAVLFAYYPSASLERTLATR